MHGATCFLTFSHQHDAAVFGFTESLFNHFLQLVHFCGNFRNDGRFGSRGDGSVQSQETGVPAHNLDEKEAFVRGCSITDLIHCVQYGVQGCVITDGGISAINIIINGTWQAYNGVVKFGRENAGACQRTITTNHHQGINLLLNQGIVG
ncbi:MAG: hypothetical protein BWY72_01954 [Bacteroidetes bacterium ADurb.Bin416]|nr:MAG: hypothetical protein BWY72_01954 [Bacteroidetes bacterium ADurb.Bin416]